MKIKWLGHSAFAITSKDNKIIITDPFDAGYYGGGMRYPKITVTADIVTTSHSHPDHGGIKLLPGKPQVINQSGEFNIGSIKITGITSWHDTKQGKERGNNIVFVYEIDAIRMAHLGDLGHIPTKEQLDKIGQVDILLIPVGGHFTIDAAQATEVASKMAPKIVIPMHYKTDALDFPITGVDDFLAGKQNINKLTSPEVAITKETLPDRMEIWVLPYPGQDILRT